MFDKIDVMNIANGYRNKKNFNTQKWLNGIYSDICTKDLIAA